MTGKVVVSYQSGYRHYPYMTNSGLGVLEQ